MISIRHTCDRLFWCLTHVLTPGLRNSQHAYLRLLEGMVRPGMRWLDIGCGHRLTPAWLADADAIEERLTRGVQIIGIDMDVQAIAQHRSIQRRAAADSVRLPFADASFDLITANMVVEHLTDPAAALHEVQRVLKPGGRFVFHTTNRRHPLVLAAAALPQPVRNLVVRFLEGRDAHDVYPTHYRFNRPTDIRRIAHHAGLNVKHLRLTESSPSTVMCGPLVALEMAYIRLTRLRWLAPLRSNILGVIERGREPVRVDASVPREDPIPMVRFHLRGARRWLDQSSPVLRKAA